MKAAISGGSGFVGLSLTETLLRAGHSVLSVSDRSMPAAAMTHFAKLPGRLETLRLDVGASVDFAEIWRDSGVDVLFPLAAITPAAEREAQDAETIVDVNVRAAIAQIKGAKQAGLRRVVVPSSVSVYGRSQFSSTRLREDLTPCLPETVYGASKYCLETSAIRLGQLWGLDVVAVRIGNVFGKWEHPSGARETFGPVFRLLDLASRGEHVILPATFPRFSGIYSEDLARALAHLAAAPACVHRIYNACGGEDLSGALPRWVELLSAAFPGCRLELSSDPTRVTFALYEPRPRALVDIDRIRSSGWSPAFSTDQAFADYLRWVRTIGRFQAESIP